MCMKTLADANRAGVRIAGVDGTATFRASHAASSNATHVTVKGVDEAVSLMKAGQADAIALSRESLTGLKDKIPGSHILDGGFLNSTTAVAVPLTTLVPRKPTLGSSSGPRSAASRTAPADFSTGSDSPVRIDWLTNRSLAERRMTSAGTMSPADRWMMSPGTS